MVDLIEIVFFPCILFIMGFFLIRWVIQKKRLNISVITLFLINIIWLFINILLMFIILNFLGNYSLFKIIIIFPNIIVGIAIIWGFNNKPILDSFIVISITQITLFVISIFLSTIPEIIDIFLITGDDQLDGSKFSFVFIFLFLTGLSVFMAYWGDKIQLVKHRRTLVCSAIAPGIYYLLNVFIIHPINFYNMIVINILSSFTIAFISTYVIKTIVFRTIQFKELRGLIVLEKGKPLLNVKNLKVHYPLYKGVLKRQVGAVKAVNGISFNVKTGETLGIVGESGCGKTTIAKAILGLVDITEGEILFHENLFPHHYSSGLRQKIQMVFQDPDASLNPRLKIVDIISEPLKNLYGITDKLELRKRVLRLLDQVSLKREHMDRYPHEFSGGQKQRIVIARALACNPELIFLDEPTSALDVSVQAQILNLLKDLQKKYGYGFVFITHNLAVVNHIADRVAVMYLGKIVEVGGINQIFLNPTHPYTQALLASRSEIDPYNQEISFVIHGEVPSPIAPPPGCTFNPRCSSDARTKECEIEIPHKIEIEDGHFIWCVNPPKSMQSTIQESKESLSVK